jgi:hypothetical protein
MIEQNRIQLAGSARPAIEVDGQGAYPPMNLVIRANTVEVALCARPAVSCHASQCAVLGNRQLSRTSGLACPD